MRWHSQQALGGLLFIPMAALVWGLVKAWQWAAPQVQALIERALE